MNKYAIILLCIPMLLRAQEPVKPVISPDYLSLINHDSTPPKKNDAPDSLTKYWRVKEPYLSVWPVKAVKCKNGGVSVLPAKKTWLTLGGNYTIAAAIRKANTTPALQNKYVQGQSLNGVATWQGAESDEMFSYGPSIHTLEYDGSSYPYDSNGKLVTAGTGDGKKAVAYNNSIFRTGYRIEHALSLQANIKKEYWPPVWSFSLKASVANETLPIYNNSNATHSFFASVERYIHKVTVSGSYRYFSSRFSNDNNNGFLNRVYENALLTPVSFINAQSLLPVNGRQKSYSSNADNPWLLLKDNGHSAELVQQTRNVSVQKKQGLLTFGVLSSIDAVSSNSNQSLKAGTAFFPSGLPFMRQQYGRNSTTDAYAVYNIRYNTYRYTSVAKVNYIYTHSDANIRYPAAGIGYHYHRSTNEASFNFNTTYSYRDIYAGLNGGNRFYASGTSPQHKLLLPGVSGFIRFTNIIDYVLDAKLVATYSSFNSEPPVNTSYAPYMLTQLAPKDALTFMPVTEVLGFTHLQAIQHGEFTTKVQLDIMRRVTLNADISVRTTKGDILPVYENNTLLLKNLADIRYKGFELQLDVNGLPTPTRDFSTSNSASFYVYSNTVTHVENGYNGMALAGFSTVHKTLLEGQPLGVITGNTYLRGAANKILIGDDGFPLVNNQLSVIGNPTPDFILKFSHIVSWKNFTLNLDWEYRKGGDVWNGTQAVLDYYGRSAVTAGERGITGYVFDGLSQNGSHNNVPVKFYDASLPVEQNRWLRYGYTGVAEAYIQKGDNLRIHTLSLACTLSFKKYVQSVRLLAYAENLVLWSAYKGADPGQLLYGQPSAGGLDFFNLPSTKSFGINVSIQL